MLSGQKAEDARSEAAMAMKRASQQKACEKCGLALRALKLLAPGAGTHA